MWASRVFVTVMCVGGVGGRGERAFNRVLTYKSRAHCQVLQQVFQVVV